MTDPRLNDPVLGKDRPAVGVWSWITISVILAMSAAIIVAGLNSDQKTQRVAKTEATPPPPIVRECQPPEAVGNGVFFFDCTDVLTFFRTLAQFKGEQWEKGMHMVGIDATIARRTQVAIFEPR